jgi:hypothetical protein
MKSSKLILTLAMAGSFVTSALIAKEVKIAMKDCPAAVQKAFAEKAGAGKITSTESITEKDGKITYEAGVTMADGKEMEVVVGADGKLIQTETMSKLKDCPAAVQKGFAAAIPGGKVAEEVEIITKADGTMLYEAAVEVKEDEDMEVVIGADGKLISKQEMEEEADEKEEQKEDEKEEKKAEKKQ